MADNLSSSKVQPAQERVAWARLPMVALLAAVASAVGCALLFAAESRLGVIDHSVPLPSMVGTGPVSVTSVTVAAAAGSVWAAVAFAVTGAIGRSPIRVFRIVSAVALLLSLALPATVPGPSLAMRFGLALMHVLVWVTNVAILTTLGKR